MHLSLSSLHKINNIDWTWQNSLYTQSYVITLGRESDAERPYLGLQTNSYVSKSYLRHTVSGEDEFA